MSIPTSHVSSKGPLQLKEHGEEDVRLKGEQDEVVTPAESFGETKPTLEVDAMEGNIVETKHTDEMVHPSAIDVAVTPLQVVYDISSDSDDGIPLCPVPNKVVYVISSDEDEGDSSRDITGPYNRTRSKLVGKKISSGSTGSSQGSRTL